MNVTTSKILRRKAARAKSSDVAHITVSFREIKALIQLVDETDSALSLAARLEDRWRERCQLLESENERLQAEISRLSASGNITE